MKSEKLEQPNDDNTMVPFEKFVEVRDQLMAVQKELENIKQQTQSEPEKTDPVAPIPNEEDIFKRMVEDPQGYLSELMANIVQNEMSVMREQLELANAMRFARQKYPEFKSFEKHILQEVMSVLDADAEGGMSSWEDLLDKGFQQLQEKFKAAVKQSPGDFVIDNIADIKKAQFENAGNRKQRPLLPSFSREQIANMSLQEFMKHESAINDALKNNRIR